METLICSNDQLDIAEASTPGAHSIILTKFKQGSCRATLLILQSLIE